MNVNIPITRDLMPLSDDQPMLQTPYMSISEDDARIMAHGLANGVTYKLVAVVERKDSDYRLVRVAFDRQREATQQAEQTKPELEGSRKQTLAIFPVSQSPPYGCKWYMLRAYEWRGDDLQKPAVPRWSLKYWTGGEWQTSSEWKPNNGADYNLDPVEWCKIPDSGDKADA